jgi:hypothetical protein
MKPIYTLFADRRAAERAVRNLRAAGVAERDIVVMSGEPMEDSELARLHTPTWMWYIATAGGAVGCAAAVALTRVTQYSWPIQTGNMSIAPWWPNLIIMFELTMLGGILATVATLVVSGGLLRRRPAFYEPAVSQGKILVGVENPPDGAVHAIERALKS